MHEILKEFRALADPTQGRNTHIQAAPISMSGGRTNSGSCIIAKQSLLVLIQYARPCLRDHHIMGT